MLLSRRDLTVRYRQTVLGTIWIFGGPLVSAGLFTFVFGRVAELPSDGIPYFVFSYAGLLAWNLFSNTLQKSSVSLTNNVALVTKIYFPRLALPFSTVASSLINTGISFLITIVLLFVYGIELTGRMFWLPLWLTLAMFLAMGIGLILGSIAVSYRDINYLTPMFTSLLLYLSPVAYGTDAVPQELRQWYLLNPLTTIVEGCRWSVVGDAVLSRWAFAYTVALTAATFVAGLVVFSRQESRFADVI